MKNRNIATVIAVGVATLSLFAGCSSAPSTGFGQITTGGAELVKATGEAPKTVPDAKALKEQWDEKAKKALEQSKGKFQYRNALFLADGNTLQPRMGTASISNAKVIAGGKGKLVYACFSVDADVKVPVAIKIGENSYIGGTFTCGKNVQVEGEILFEIPPTKSLTVYTGRVPHEGYSLYGLTMD